MKLYACSNCNRSLYFENSVCLNCKHPVGFDSKQLTMITLQSQNNTAEFSAVKTKSKYKYCLNKQYGNCNWLVPVESTADYCEACKLNRTIPPLTNPQNQPLWNKIEIAKHRLVYSLLRLGLPVEKKINNNDTGIAFDFLAELSPEEKIMTGHDNGVITLNINEADDAERARHKLDLGERYRTLLGHFRHEIGHYYWDALIRNTDLLSSFRSIFGDESMDYAEALNRYYHSEPNPDWQNDFISVYATAHPWEDWAETWAHYMHIMDTLETAYFFGMGLNTIEPAKDSIKTAITKDPYTVTDFNILFNMWVPLTFAVNNLNRSMGHSDFYPFVISEPVVKKLSFIHDVCKVNRDVK
ncbi:MAG: zinc-binding metallopeptidase family protein [Cytophaga sp.]|uniref:zinc-binding metallopeptidase family protein n=1 Tax=Cytophaga sp. TaxID=29535 RepID=UPI003F7F857C